MDRSHIVEVPPYFRMLRMAQIVFSVLILALSAASIGILAGSVGLGGPGYSIFVCFATILISVYYLISTGSKPNMYNRIAVLVLEVLMFLWWLSSWTTLAYWASWVGWYDWGYGFSGSLTALHVVLAIAALVAAVCWVTITVTLVTFVMRFLRHNKQQNQPIITHPTPNKLEAHQMQPQAGGYGGQPQGQYYN